MTELEKAGGRLFVRAPVDEILVDRATGKVMGVQLKKKQRCEAVGVRDRQGYKYRDSSKTEVLSALRSSHQSL